jgi:hypothetical protein
VLVLLVLLLELAAEHICYIHDVTYMALHRQRFPAAVSQFVRGECKAQRALVVALTEQCV